MKKYLQTFNLNYQYTLKRHHLLIAQQQLLGKAGGWAGIAATSSRSSINKKLVSHAAEILEKDIIDDAEIEIIDIIDFEMPLYSIDREKENGIPEQAQRFYNKIGDSDALLISFAEHNGYYTAVYKNLFDWTSRIDKKLYQDKPAVIMASSPGPSGARHVLKVAKEAAPFHGMKVQAVLSIPRFYEKFDVQEARLKDGETKVQMEMALARLN